MRAAVIVFPGSNCDRDSFWAVEQALGEDAVYVWHRENRLPDVDLVILPGGFSYGDYLRTGAFARFSPVMAALKRYSGDGGLVLGICNGFQVLLESGLLPGAMIANKKLRFLCRNVFIRTERTDTPFSEVLDPGRVLRMPIAHFAGNYFAPPEVLDDIESKGQVLFRYCDSEGNVTRDANPNGSSHNIAGLLNREGNVLGMMPHPERAGEEILGSVDGLGIFESVLRTTRAEALEGV